MLSDRASQSSPLSEKKNNDLQVQEVNKKLWKVFRSGVV